MKNFILSHKGAAVAAGAIILLLLSAIAAVIANKQSHKTEVPAGRIHDAGVFGEDITIYDSSNGPVVIDVSDTGREKANAAAAPLKLVSNPDEIWNDSTYAGSHTPVEKAGMANGSIGVLTIDKLGLSVNVFDSGSEEMMADMAKGIAHFPSTSAWDGCVGLSAHNINFDGSAGYFKYLYTLSEGDTVHYKTALGERTYTVKSVSTIAASDWTPLYHTDYNQVVMITCISGQPNNRLCITAVEQSAK